MSWHNPYSRIGDDLISATFIWRVKRNIRTSALPNGFLNKAKACEPKIDIRIWPLNDEEATKLASDTIFVTIL
jgi:hypothetical protein